MFTPTMFSRRRRTRARADCPSRGRRAREKKKQQTTTTTTTTTTTSTTTTTTTTTTTINDNNDNNVIMIIIITTATTHHHMIINKLTQQHILTAAPAKVCMRGTELAHGKRGRAPTCTISCTQLLPCFEIKAPSNSRPHQLPTDVDLLD